VTPWISGQIAAGEPVAFSFTVGNGGDEALVMSALSATSESADLDDVGFTPVADFFACGLNFTPRDRGPVAVEISVTTNDPASPLEFTIAALATAPELRITNGLAPVDGANPFTMTPTAVGETFGVALTARNIGNADLDFEDTTVTDASGGNPADLTRGFPHRDRRGRIRCDDHGVFPDQRRSPRIQRVHRHQRSGDALRIHRLDRRPGAGDRDHRLQLQRRGRCPGLVRGHQRRLQLQ
jgi:hypothetical protein